MGPIFCPSGGRRRHTSMSVDVICSTEVNRIPTFLEGQKMVQEACFGNGKSEVNSVSKSASVLQAHRGSEPNDREGMSVSALSTPAMWSGVSGEHCRAWRRKASARTRCIATRDCFDAKRWTQCTVGVLSLISATCVLAGVGHTASTTSHRSKRPAILRSEFVMVPEGFNAETMLCWIVGGQAR